MSTKEHRIAKRGNTMTLTCAGNVIGEKEFEEGDTHEDVLAWSEGIMTEHKCDVIDTTAREVVRHNVFDPEEKD